MREFSFSDLNRRSGEVLDAALEEPVRLVKRGRVRLVLVPVTQYQKLVSLARAGGRAKSERPKIAFSSMDKPARGDPPALSEASKAERISALRSLALSRYAAQCFWNVKVPDGSDGDKIIVERLKKHGDMNAWRLASQIEALADAA